MELEVVSGVEYDGGACRGVAALAAGRLAVGRRKGMLRQMLPVLEARERW